MKYYAGIDVSLGSSSLCVVDASGTIFREAKVASEPAALISWFLGLGGLLLIRRVDFALNVSLGCNCCADFRRLVHRAGSGIEQTASKSQHPALLLPAPLPTSGEELVCLCVLLMAVVIESAIERTTPIHNMVARILSCVRGIFLCLLFSSCHGSNLRGDGRVCVCVCISMWS